jgi:hypothetical protein
MKNNKQKKKKQNAKKREVNKKEVIDKGVETLETLKTHTKLVELRNLREQESSNKYVNGFMSVLQFFCVGAFFISLLFDLHLLVLLLFAGMNAGFVLSSAINKAHSYHQIKEKIKLERQFIKKKLLLINSMLGISEVVKNINANTTIKEPQTGDHKDGTKPKKTKRTKKTK